MTKQELGAFGLAGFFLRGAKVNPNGIALEVGEQKVTYEELSRRAAKIGAAIRRHRRENSVRHVGILASHSIDCFASVLGILLSGNAYVPLIPSFPSERLAYMIESANLELIVAHPSLVSSLRDLRLTATKKLIILLVGTREIPASFGTDMDLVSLGGSEGADVDSAQPPSVKSSDTAYTMFTSGSTGRPKGVEISHGNISAFLNYVLQRYELGAGDRFSQMFELTFDLSLFDMFVCWAVGGTLCVVPAASRLAPAKFIREKHLTVWFSVPSVGSALAKLKGLRPGAFPSVRLSLFCGEALTQKVAELWAEAAPNSILENLYGPTEATVACACYRWDRERSPAECKHGIVPIGQVFPGHQAQLVDAKGNRVPDGKQGELWIAGPQVCRGYLGDAGLTSERFSRLPRTNSNAVFYHTGDCVSRGASGQMIFRGRADFQIKINGYRVELGEIENCLRIAAQSEMAAAICSKDAEGRVTAIIGFVEATGVDSASILMRCKRQLPPYMMPSRIVRLDRMPLNSNGKIDRKQLMI